MSDDDSVSRMAYAALNRLAMAESVKVSGYDGNEFIIRPRRMVEIDVTSAISQPEQRQRKLESFARFIMQLPL